MSNYTTMQSLAFSIQNFLKQNCCYFFYPKRKGFVKKVRKGKKVPCDFWRYGNLLGVFFVIWFIIFFAWYFIRPAEQTFDFEFLKINFFFFRSMGWKAFISGLIQSYIWGYIAVATWMLAVLITGRRK